MQGLDEIVAVRQLLDRFEAHWLTGLSELARTGETETVCGMSTTDWLATTTRCTRPEARAKINVAKRLAATTLIQHELADGELSLSQSTLLVRGRTKRTADYFDEHEPFLTATAKDLSADQLAVLIAQWHRRADAATADTDDTDVINRRELFLAPVGTTEWMLRGTLTAEQGDLVNEALTAIAQTEHDGADDTRPYPQRRADSLASLSRFWLDHQTDTTTHGQRPHVSVHVDAADIAGLAGAVLNGRTASGMTLDAPTTQRLLCDCILTRILTSSSVVLDAGRPSRTIPTSIRRAVIARDQHCRYPGCNRPPAWTDVHHVHHWQDGGSHSLDNCVLLCRRHHDRVHRLNEHIVLHHDATIELTTHGVTQTSRPPPNPAQLFTTRPSKKPRDPVHLQREHDAVVRALQTLQHASQWTDTDHHTADHARQRLLTLTARTAADRTAAAAAMAAAAGRSAA